MKNYFSAFVLLLLSQVAFGQTNFLWKGYFSYSQIKDLSQSPTVFYAAAENALFSKNLATNILKTTNTVDGLSGLTITALYHSPTFNKTMVGYENGLIIVINEVDGTMLNVVDIINKQLPPTIKKVNHFAESNGIVYVSCDFGIVQYDLASLGFGDTYFIGDNGTEIIVSQTTVFDGYIYAATSAGIRRALVTNPNLIDFTQWSQIAAGSWIGVEAFGSELIAVTTTGQVNRFNGTVFNPYASYSQVVDIRKGGDYLIITTAARVYVYNQTLGIAAQVDNYLIPEVNATFTCATVIGDQIYMGTLENGVVTSTITNPIAFEVVSPDGPSKNNMFSINKESSNLWVCYGDYTVDYDMSILKYYGLSKFNTETGWKNIPYSELHAPGKEATNLVRITVNPADENNIFVSSYHSGLLELQDDELVMQYDETNSGLLSLIVPSAPSYVSVRVEQSVFDRAGNLWMAESLVEAPLKVLKPDGSWSAYELPVTNNFSTARFGKMVIDKNGTKWICTYSDGLVAFNENGNIAKKISAGTESGNLPTDYVRTVAIDQRNQVWIGTYKGLSILSSVDRFQNDGQMTTNPIIILDEGTPRPLLYEQAITDIAVDGANNKWIGTADTGVFMVSPNGQETIYRFTADNSPLPSNNINDIEINGVTGEVFIATSKGLVSFKGTATDPKDNLNNVIVYPNPVRPEFVGTVKITGLIDNANIKIADIEGNLVYETVSEGGTIEWDTTAFGKYRVASGVYLIFISAEDGVETKVKKVMIIR